MIVCNGCNAQRQDVAVLVEFANDVHICDGCVDICVDIVAKHKRRNAVAQESQQPPAAEPSKP